MGIESWSTTAGSNNAASPNGFPEGMAASGLNDSARQMMASIRAWYEDAQWVNLGDTPTRIDNDTFTVSGDKTATYHVGRRLKLTGSATGYGAISATTYNAPNTVIDVTMDSGTIPATLSTVYIGICGATNTSVPVNNNPTWSGTAAAASLTLSGTLTIGTPLGIASGGTSANTVAGARSALGVSATGSDTTYAFRGNNLSDLTNAAAARNNLSVPSTTGGNASGTWPINISGNAATASSASSASTATVASSITGQAASATTDTTNASNISTGTLAAARHPNVFTLPGVTIQSDPGGTPTLAYGQVAFYY